VGDERKPLADVHLDGAPAASSEVLHERSAVRAAGEGLAAFLVAVPASFLPARWRRGAITQLPLPTAGVLSGLVEAIGALIAGAWLFERYRHRVADQAMEMMGRALADGRMAPGHEGHVIGALPTMGATLLIGFLLSPAGIGCLVFFGEGLVRLAAGFAGEVVGTWPLALAAAAIDWVRRPARSEFERYDAHHRFEEDARMLEMRERVRKWRRDREPRPMVPDDVRKNDLTGEVRIYTAHDFGWKPRSTIEVDGELYELAGEGPAPPPHVHEYALRKVTAGTAIRNVVVYR